MAEVFLRDPDFTLYVGDVRKALDLLPDKSVQCVVTSPPYWGLRDYGTGEWEGGDPACDHRRPGNLVSPKSTLRNDGREHQGPYEGEKAVRIGMPFTAACGKCGATRVDLQIGLEPTPEEYVASMVGVFEHVWRVLRDDGTVWLNLGDTYFGGGSTTEFGQNTQNFIDKSTIAGTYTEGQTSRPIKAREHPYLKQKDLIGIPWRVAFALQAGGWYLRSEVIWAKPNPMPESVTDRPSKSHEQIFLLTKQARYFYDSEAIKEEAAWQRENEIEQGRNKRSVWEVATKPYADAHFATFPPDLIEPCILAGTSERGCCAECGAPWERKIEKREKEARDYPAYGDDARAQGISRDGPNLRKATLGGSTLARYVWETVGWEPGCTHDAEVVPCVVLDPFMGSGTTAEVARKHGRRSIGVELKPEYAALAARRLSQQSIFA